MTMEFETMILRFRDLVTADNETILNHQEIIKNHGYVWWAWWKKGNELPPETVFALLSHNLPKTPMTLYLLDSGLRNVYKATCTGLDFDSNIKIPSPEKDKSPAYYREQQYHAWFKFTNIKECEPTELENYTYVECPELFGQDKSDYSRFHGKKIFSVQEMLQQNRTLWFVRTATKADRTGEIVLLNADYVMPENFTKRYFQTADNRILWLSDLHLPDHVFEDKPEGIKATMSTQICETLDNSNEKNIGALLISGDITSRGETVGFKQALQLIQGISSGIHVPLIPSTIAICPGNHDFIREKDPLEKGKIPEFIYDKPDNSKDYSEFYHTLYNIEPDQFFASGRKWLLPSGHLVEIAALNSLILQQYSNFEGHGYLSQVQLDHVAEEMGWKTSQNQKVVRIVMMHHHYIPVCYSEEISAEKASSAVYDANRLMEWLVKYNVKILLHGHKHKSFFSQIRYPKASGESVINNQDFHQLSVVGMGGTGARGSDNLFATIHFDENDVIFSFYRISHDEVKKGQLIQTIQIPL